MRLTPWLAGLCFLALPVLAAPRHRDPAEWRSARVVRDTVDARDSLRVIDTLPAVELPRPDSLYDTPQADSLVLPHGDTLRYHLRDSLRQARQDSLELLRKSSLEHPAFSTAKDSTIEVFSDGHRIIYYYGDVSVEYQGMKLNADYMEIGRAHV